MFSLISLQITYIHYINILLYKIINYSKNISPPLSANI